MAKKKKSSSEKLKTLLHCHPLAPAPLPGSLTHAGWRPTPRAPFLRVQTRIPHRVCSQDASPSCSASLLIFLLNFLFLDFWRNFFIWLFSLSAHSTAASALHLLHLLNTVLSGRCDCVQCTAPPWWTQVGHLSIRRCDHPAPPLVAGPASPPGAIRCRWPREAP